MSSYVVLKDFAGPLATLIAAITAVFVTAKFSHSQLRIAESQRDIALDKLKFDLFAKRYKIYAAAKELIEHLALLNDLDQADAMKIRSLYVTLDEARFYFSPEICNLLGDLHSRSELFLAHRGMARIRNMDIDEDLERNQNAELLASDQSMLRAIYASLPVDFAPALAFKQLTSH